MTTPPRFSLEFFPPQSIEASFRLWDAVAGLAPLGPEFVSMTYGAGGSTRQLTQEAAGTIRRNHGLPVAAHLTCVGASQAETLETAEAFRAEGIRHVVALRGDPPKGEGRYRPHPQGFAHSVDLVAALARRGWSEITVGAYPERHPDAPDPTADVRWLKRKVDAGASRAITQFFFEAETFLRFRDDCVAAGIHVPLVPGILPIQSWQGARRFAGRCGAKVPQRLDEGFAKAARDGREALFALVHSLSLVERLRAEGVEDFHFYTLNRADLTGEILHAFGIRPAGAIRKVA